MSAPEEPRPKRKHPVAPKEGEGTLWAGRRETSKRTRNAFRSALHAVAAPVARVALRALWSTQRLRVVAGGEHLGALAGEPCVPCLWHGDLGSLLRWLVADRPAGLAPAFLISPSIDGDVPTRVAEKWCFHVVRGSATRTGGRAIRQLYHAIKKERVSPVILADGPQGPARVAKPGPVMLSQLAQVAILPLGFAATRAVRMKTWDRASFPLPFARIDVVVGEPIRIPRDLATDALDAETERLGAELDRANAAALAAARPGRSA